MEQRVNISDTALFRKLMEWLRNAVLSENKLTVVSGAYLSTDMMERQSFSQLLAKFAENVKY